MPKRISDIALAKVPSFANRVSLFQSKLQITRHASGTIVDYSHALYKAVVYIGKLPEEFTQEDADGYLSYLLSRQPQPAVSQFKHFIYGLKSYLHAMGYPDLAGLALPRIRREKRLPRVLSVEQVQQLLRSCDLYTMACSPRHAATNSARFKSCSEERLSQRSAAGRKPTKRYAGSWDGRLESARTASPG